MKQCCECGEMKSLQDFHKNKGFKGGFCPDCKVCRNKRYRTAYREDKSVRERVLKRSRLNYQKDKGRQMEKHRERYKRMVTKVFTLLGNKCSRCNEKDKRILQVDHINGGGRQHLRTLDKSWFRFYTAVIKSVEGDKKEFQLLCVRCNWIEGIEKGYRKTIW